MKFLRMEERVVVLAMYLRVSVLTRKDLFCVTIRNRDRTEHAPWWSRTP